MHSIQILLAMSPNYGQEFSGSSDDGSAWNDDDEISGDGKDSAMKRIKVYGKETSNHSR